MRKKSLLSKIIAGLLCFLMIFSVFASIVPVHAAEIGVVGSDEEPADTDEYIEEEVDETPSQGAMNFEDFFGTLKEEVQSAISEENTGELDVSGEGYLSVRINVSDDFYENIQLELYNRDTTEIVKVPIYAVNKWVERTQIPAGRYTVSNVIAGGDNPANPQWIFEMGDKIELDTDGEASLVIELLRGPNFTNEGAWKEEEPVDGATDTDNTKVDEQVEVKTLGQTIKDFIWHLVSGSNFIILLVLAGSCLGVWIIKKKREDN